MNRIRVLIVDDSVVVRRVLTKIFESTPDIEVAGIAATASIGIQKISQVQPDVVVLDVEMPEMGGIEAVTHIRSGWPRLPVLMCSSLTERGAEVTVRALAAGATDYVAKPSSLGAETPDFASELVTKVRALAGRRSVTPPARPVLVPRASGAIPAMSAARGSIDALTIGCSTGGPSALAAIFSKLPPLPVPIFIVQHMPPLFTRMLAERLNSSATPVVEGSAGHAVVAGTAYIAPGGSHMTVERSGAGAVLALNQDPPENSCRPAVDVLFRSVAQLYRENVLGVVLTGMGHDGQRGAERIVGAGGLMIVQDAASSVVPSMPMSVANAGYADAVVPLDQIAGEITRRVLRGRTSRPFLRSEAS